MILTLLLLACATPEAPEIPAATEVIEAPAAVDKPGEAPARVNLNTASKDALATIPNMTPKMVHEFEEYRPYVSIRQFRKQIGKYVDAEQVAAWEPHVFVPVAFNDCDGPTLAQLPGLEQAAGEALIAGRPYADRDAFIAALTEQVGAEHAKAGASLLQ